METTVRKGTVERAECRAGGEETWEKGVSEEPRWESVREEGEDSQVGQREDRRARGLERPSHLVTRAHWRPARAKVKPRRTLTGWQGEARWRFKIYGGESAKRINRPIGTGS